MKDLIASDRYGFERILMQVLVPGLIALGPFAWMLYLIHRPDPQLVAQIAEAVAAQRTPPLLPDRPLMTFAINNKELAVFVVLVFAIVVGLVIEDIGSWIEKHLIDRWNRRFIDRNLDPIWAAYLTTQETDKESYPVMASYMTGLVPRMKFQLSIGVALVFFGAGMAWLWEKKLLKFEETSFYFVSGAVVLGVGLEFFKARSYCALLHRNRVLDLQARKILPQNYRKPTSPGGNTTAVALVEPRSCCERLRTFQIYPAVGTEIVRLVVVGEPENPDKIKLPATRAVWSAIRFKCGRHRCPHFEVGKHYYLHTSLIS